MNHHSHLRKVFFITLLAALATPGAAAGRFYPDDPLEREPAPRDASQAVRRKISDYYDFFLHTFAKPGERHTPRKPIPAQAVNTLGEAMDGAWYTRRHYYRPMSLEELARGPGNENAPSADGVWTVVKAKSEGITPGFEIVDSRGRRYVLKFDPLRNPEISTAPDVLVSKFFHALGYHVPENYIVHFTREQLALGKDVQLLDEKGKARPMTARDVTEMLMNVPKDSRGRYRGGASLYLSGKPLGPFKYYRTRRDDPNDVVPHEHRRDLRGLSVFCAWLGHDDSRAINTIDFLVEEGGRSYIRHYLIDFGSTLGSASYGPNSPRSGFEYLFEWGPAAKNFFTLGLAVPAWARAYYPNLPSVGRFESKVFDAKKWVAEYPNPAFSNRLPDDAFWAAKQVMAFTDEQIRAIVATGQYSNPQAAYWVADCLIERRDKIGRAFFAQLLPLDRFAVRDGKLVFTDLEVAHQFVPARSYQYQWSLFDNAAGTKTPLPGETSATVPAGRAPAGGYLAVDIHAGDEKKSLSVYLGTKSGKMEVVGVDRRW